jgi:hypothetical protein
LVLTMLLLAAAQNPGSIGVMSLPSPGFQLSAPNGLSASMMVHSGRALRLKTTSELYTTKQLVSRSRGQWELAVACHSVTLMQWTQLW